MRSPARDARSYPRQPVPAGSLSALPLFRWSPTSDTRTSSTLGPCWDSFWSIWEIASRFVGKAENCIEQEEAR